VLVQEAAMHGFDPRKLPWIQWFEDSRHAGRFIGRALADALSGVREARD
jgi:hypothetical protein